MEKLKEKNKHNHLFTKILKVSIFALVMLAPMFSVVAKCMYVAFNKNAKDSYYGETINERQQTNIDNIDSFKIGTTYYFTNTSSFVINNWTLDLRVHDLFNINNQTLVNAVNRIRFASSEAGSFIYYYSNVNGYLGNFPLNTNQNLSFVFDSYTSSTNYTNQLNDYIYYFTYNDYSYIDNVFYYSVEQIGNEQIFSWTKNTGIYGAINTMTTGLGIDPTNNILAVLLTYWSLMTAVYIIIDIVIEMFVRLTHLLA